MNDITIIFLARRPTTSAILQLFPLSRALQLRGRRVFVSRKHYFKVTRYLAGKNEVERILIEKDSSLHLPVPRGRFPSPPLRSMSPVGQSLGGFKGCHTGLHVPSKTDMGAITEPMVGRCGLTVACY